MTALIEKNKEYIVNIIDNGFQGEGIAKIDGFTVFVNGALKGEKIRILVVKVLSSYAYGKILEILEPSEYRKEPDCKTYKRCGGCSLRHIDYNETLRIKQNVVQSLVNKALHKTKLSNVDEDSKEIGNSKLDNDTEFKENAINVEPTIGMENPFFYRNKAQYPVGIDKNGEPVIGVFANRTHEVIPIEKCLIQDQTSEEIAKKIIDFIKIHNISVYNESTGKGLFRHIVVKIGKKSKEIMCIFVINGNEIPYEQELVKTLIQKYPNIKTIVKNINNKNTNVILGDKNIVLYGDGYIQDKLGDYTFKISPFSFYQVNPVQAEKLYNIGIDGAKLSKDDIVFDLYCGIGTISIFMAKYVKKVYGVEIVEQAIEDAKNNAKLNGIENVEFIAGDTEKVVDDLINNKKIIPNVVMVDPPRKGLDDRTIQNILKIHPDRFVYISCNPATLVRDLAKVENDYKILKIQPVDMFPYTSSVECVAVMKKI